MNSMLKIPILISLLVFSLNLPIYSQTTPQTKTGGAGGEKETKSFQSDGCTMWFDGGYLSCCEAHDEAYFKSTGWRARLKADNRLFMCVAKKGVGYSITAPMMWVAVRIFGSPWFPIHKKKKFKATK